MSKRITLNEFGALLRGRRRRILTITATAVLFGIALALILPPRYEGRVIVMAAEPDDYRGGIDAVAGQFADFADLAGIGLQEKGDVEMSLAVLTSRRFTNRFLVEEHVLPELFPKMWDAANQAWKPVKRSWPRRMRDSVSRAVASVTGDHAALANPPIDAGPSLWEAFRLFDKLRSVARDRRTGLITISIQWRDPELAARWANQLVQRVNDEIRHNAVRESEGRQRYLADQLDKTAVVELRQALFRISESEQRKAMLATVRKEYAFRIIDPAVVPKQRVSPKRTVIVFSMALIGLFLAFSSVLLSELLREPNDRAT